MVQVRDGDVVVYADAGCTLHAHNWPRFYEYIQLVRGLPQPQILSFIVRVLPARTSPLPFIRNWKRQAPLGGLGAVRIRLLIPTGTAQNARAA